MTFEQLKFLGLSLIGTTYNVRDDLAHAKNDGRIIGCQCPSYFKTPYEYTGRMRTERGFSCFHFGNNCRRW